ncbi:MAG: hypothetical protein K6F72_00665 [Bacteroidales bacterium]|nr:hypothetical protein [Bacteroidales bacterium]
MNDKQNDNHKNLKDLHGFLTSEGYELPDYAEFENDMSTPQNLQDFYTFFRKEGYDLPTSFSEFENDMGFATQPQQPATPAVQGLPVNPATFAPMAPAAPSSGAVNVRAPFADVQAAQQYEQQKPTSPTQPTNPTYPTAAQNKQEQPLGPERFAKQMAMDQQLGQMSQGISQRLDAIRKGNQPFSSTERRLNPETGKMETAYYTKTGEVTNTQLQQSRRNAEINEAFKEPTVNEELQEAYAERDRLQHEIARREKEIETSTADNVEEGIKKLPATQQRAMAEFLRRNAPKEGDKSRDAELSMLRAALRSNEEHINTLEREKDNPNYIQVVGKGLTSADNWLGGFNNLADMITMLRYSGEELEGTEAAAQEAMLKNRLLADDANTRYGQNDSAGQRWGDISAQAIPFVAEFLLTGGGFSGIKAGTRLGEKAALKYGKNKVGKWLLKNIGSTADDIVRASIMANTTGAGRTVSDILDRHLGKLVYEDGEYKFVGGKSVGRSVYEGEMAATLQYLTEFAGSKLDAAGKVVGKGISKGLERIGAGRVTELISRMSGSEWSKMLAKLQVNDYWEEVAEEELNIILDAILVGDNKFSDLWDKRTQGDILGGMALSIGLMRAPGMVVEGGAKTYNAAQYYRYKHNTDKANKVASVQFGADNWEVLREQIDNTENKDMGALLAEIADNADMNDGNKKAAADYIVNLMKMRGYNMRTMKNAEGKSESESSEQAVADEQENQAYERGYNAEPQEQQDAMLELAMSDPSDPDHAEKQAAVAGINDRINDDADNFVAQEREAYNLQRNDDDGSVHPATMTVDGQEREVFIKSGLVTTGADGSIDIENSGETIVVYDPVEGKNKMVSPADIRSLGEVTTAEQFESDLQNQRADFIQQQQDAATGRFNPQPGQEIDMPDGKAVVLATDGESGTLQMPDGSQQSMAIADIQQIADGVMMEDYRQRHPETAAPEQPAAEAPAMTEGKPETFEPNMELTVKDGDGEKTVYVTGTRARWEAGKFVEDPNGKFIELYDPEANDGNGGMTYIRDDDPDGKIVGYKPAPLEEQPIDETENRPLPRYIDPKNPPDDGGTPPPPPAGLGNLKDAKTFGEQDEGQRPNVETFTPESYTPEEPAPTSNTMPMKKVRVRKDVKDENGKPVLNKNGKPKKEWVEEEVEDWYAATPSRAYQYIYEEAVAAGLEEKDADGIVKIMQEQAQQEQADIKKKPKPVAGSVMATLQLRKERNAEIEEAQSHVDYWKQVQSLRNRALLERKEAEEAERRAAETAEQKAKREAYEAEQARRQAEAEAAERHRKEENEQRASGTFVSPVQNAEITEPIEGTKTSATPLEIAKRELADDAEAMEILNSKEPQTLEEVVSKLLTSGKNQVGIIPEDFYKHTGYSPRDAEKFIILSNNGVSIGRLGEMVEGYARNEHIPFDENDANAGFDAVLAVLGNVRTQGDINGYITNNRIRQAYDHHNKLLVKEDAYMSEQLGVTRAEYDGWVQSMEEKAEAVKNMSDEEFNTIFGYDNTLLENEKTQNNDRRAETDNGGNREESADALQGEQREGESAAAPQDDTRGVGEDAAAAADNGAAVAERIAAAEAQTDTNPTEGQKKAGNYAKGHLTLDGYNISIEQPKGSIRRGVDADGRAWEQEMHNTYGYIRGTEGVDGDHIDVFLSNDPTQGNVFVIDQVNPKDGSFDEHKVMYGFPDAESARAAYLSNYEEGWQGLGTITEVSKDEFKKWVESSHRKTKPFSEYKSVEMLGGQSEGNDKIDKPTVQQREIGQAMVDRLEDMGIKVSTDIAENRRVLKQAEQDNSEAGKLRHFRTPGGKVYGFVYRGKMYLDPRHIDAELPIHEYAHPWCEAMRYLAPERWAEVVEVMKSDAETWEAVKAMNPDLADENDIAEEMIATYSGKNGKAKAQAEFERMGAKGNFGNVWQNIAKAIQDFWKKVGDFLGIKYESAEQVYDQVVKDFANKVNPRKRIEDYLKARDEEYLKAVESGDEARAKELFDEALRENIGNGMTPYLSVDSYIGRLKNLVKRVKSRDPQVILQVAELMSPLIPQDAVLVPAPSHTGEATDMLDLSEALSRITGTPVANVLRGVERESQYQVKKEGGRPITAEQMGIVMDGTLPDDKIPVVIDNVVDSGNTAEACVKALGKGIVVSLAEGVNRRKHAATLKSANFVARDRSGNIVQLSKRFDLDGVNYLAKQKGDGKVQKPTKEQKTLVKALSDWLNKIGIKTTLNTKKGQEVLDKYRELAKLLRVWHGSGADFGRFDHAHMGEGEGAQAFGYGTYVSEVKGIGKNYAELNPNGSTRVFYKGKTIGPSKIGLRTNTAEEHLLKLIASQLKTGQSFNEAKKNVKEYLKQGITYYGNFNDAIAVSKYKEMQSILPTLKEKDFETREGQHVLYELDIPDDNGHNYPDWVITIPKSDRRKIAEAVRGLEGGPAQSVKYPTYKGGWNQLADMIERNQWAYQEVRDRLVQAFGGKIADEKKVSELMHSAGFTGVKYPAEYMTGARADGAKNYVIFDENDLKIVDKIRFHKAEDGSYEPEMKPWAYSNAMKAVEGIKQEKATAEQWLAMLQKNGGLKAGEDKWLGLSEWLKGSEAKTITKQEVLDYIRANEIQIEEVEYGNTMSDKAKKRLEEYNNELLGEIEELDSNDKSGGEVAEMAFGVLVDRYGDDFENAFELTWEHGSPRLKPKLLDMDGEVQPIHETRLSYTTEGLDNKREIALTIPTIEPWNEGDDVHFGDAGEGRAVAWVRFGETTDADGNRVLVIDEIQSKRHQEGREKGYRKVQSNSQRARHIKAQEKFESFKTELVEKYGSVLDNGSYNQWMSRFSPADLERYEQLEREVMETSFYDEAESPTVKDNRVPDAPFEKNWHEVAFKRMLRYAAENGYDKVAWTTGEQQAERYDLSKSIKDMTATGWTDYSAVRGDDAKEAKLITINTIDRGQYTQLLVDKSGKVISDVNDQFVGKQLSDIVGKDLAKRLMEDGYQTIEGDGLRIGGEGMKGFYDQILPRFADKYGKKWNVKTTDINLPNIGDNGLTMHSVDVTPEMKASVLQGQPMFFRDKDGEVYGFTVGGEIYIDPRYAKPETPVHEYTHLWAQALRNSNPTAWAQLTDEMRTVEGGRLWDYVKGRYPELKTEDELVEEVFAHYSGKRGAERLEAEMREEMKKADGIFEKAQVANIFHKLRALLNKFWTMARDLFAGKVEGVENLTAEDFADMMMGDLLHEVDPRKEANASTEARDKAYMEAVEKGDMETAQRMVNEAAKAAMPETKVVDENGMPLVVVHHTKGDFTKFDINRLGENSGDKGMYGAGFYFITKGYGDFYGNRNMDVYLNISKPYEVAASMDNTSDQYTYFAEHFNIPKLRELAMSENGKTITVGEYIDNIKAVDKEITDAGITAESLADNDELKYYRPEDRMDLYREYRIIDRCGFPLISHSSYVIAENIGSEEFSDALKRAGYDGVVVDKGEGVHEYVAFDPKQIKSADPVTYDDQGNVIPLSERFNSESNDIRFQKAGEDIEAVNSRFNEELDGFTLDNADKVIFDLGRPSEKLLEGGVVDKPIRLYGSKVAKKMRKHGFKTEDLRDLPMAVANPIAVFENIDREGNRSVLTELHTDKGNILVSIDLGKGSDADFDIVSSVFGKNGKGVVDWINNGKLRYVDKEKAQNYLRISAPIAEASDNSELVSDAKIVKDFETAKNNLQNAENNDVRYQRSSTYTTKDGVQLSMMSLFEGTENLNDNENLNDKSDLTGLRLRKLEPGKTCHVERRYEENKSFSFMGKERIESMDDVAYIFKQLENAAVENSFIVLVKDGKPIIIHTGMGGYASTTVDLRQAIAAYMSIKPEQVYFVHNHPSGSLIASGEDMLTLNTLRAAFGSDVVQDGIIIDTTSGQYGVFGYGAEERDMPKGADGEVPMKVYEFSKQVFGKDWKPQTAYTIADPKGVAEFISSHRLGEHPKMSFIIVNNRGQVVGNFFLPWTALSNIEDVKATYTELSNYINLAGGTKGVIYGNYQYSKKDKRMLQQLAAGMNVLHTPLLDVVHVDVDNDLGYHSAHDSGVMEPEAEYVTPEREAGESILDYAKRVADDYSAYEAIVKALEAANGGVMEAHDDSVSEQLHDTSREMYERLVGSSLNQFTEAMQDSMKSLESLMKAMLGDKDLKKEEVAGFENPYLVNNAMSSASHEQIEVWHRYFIDPLKEEIRGLLGKVKGKEWKAVYTELVDYLMAKHGLERNDVFAKRDAKKAYSDECDAAIRDINNTRSLVLKELKKKLNDNKIDQDTYNSEVEKTNQDIEQVKTRFEQERDAKIAALEDDPKKDARYRAFRGKDYSGLTALTGSTEDASAIDEAENKALADLESRHHAKLIEDEAYKQEKKQIKRLAEKQRASIVAMAEHKAEKMVAEYESKHDTKALWKKINAATNSTLFKLADSGIMSAEQHDRLRDMFQYYIPLQGFNDTVAEDLYAYMGGKGTLGVGSLLKGAKGRKSKADDPLATIILNGEAAIRQANRNLMKQKFLNFVLNHPGNLVSVHDIWLRKNDTTGQWERYFEADLREDDSPEVVASKMQAFEDKMAELADQDPAHYKRGRELPDVPYRVIEKKDMDQHQVLVRRNGQTVVLTINGNPRAAQALNGLTNPDVDTEKLGGKIVNGIQKFTRFLATNYTSRFIDFMAANWVRDAFYANDMAIVREDAKYARKFHKEHAKTFTVNTGILFKEWSNGELQKKIDEGTANKYERYFREFMLNGGETGWTNQRDLEKHKRDLERDLRHAEDWNVRAWKAFTGFLDIANRAIENNARFAAYVSSRDMGRSITRSIWDAKEVSINFNTKGAGSKMAGAKGQTTFGDIGAVGSGIFRTLFPFWNASVQGISNIYRAAKRRPGRFALRILAVQYLMGALIPLISQWLCGDDDDDPNSYYNLPEYVRRSNLCFRFTKSMPWITLPLPIEFRAPYGLGELSMGLITGKEHYTPEEAAKQFAMQISQVLPLDFMEGGGGWHVLMPGGAKPALEAQANESWSGLPIYKESSYDDYKANWTKGYKNTSKPLTGFTKGLNELTADRDDLLQAAGNTEHVQGYINWNPAVIEYLLRGYLGGLYSTANQLVKVGETIVGVREFEWRNMPVANRFIKEGDERTQARKLQNEYFYYVDEYEGSRKRLKDADKENMSAGQKEERQQKLDKIAAQRHYWVVDAYKPLLDALHDQKQNESEYSVVEIEELENSLRRQMVDLIHKVDDDKELPKDSIDKEVDKMLAENFERGGYTRHPAANRIANRLGGTDSYGGGSALKTEYGKVYERKRDYVDMAEDVLLQVAIKEAKEENDVQRQKGLEAYQRGITEAKEPLGYPNAKAEVIDNAMARVRTLRRQALDKYGIDYKGKLAKTEHKEQTNPSR